MADEKPTLLIFDGDVLAFIAAAAVQAPLQLANGDMTQFAKLEDGTLAIDGFIAKFRNAFAAGTAEDELVVVLSDPAANWRYDVDHNYKANRKGTELPMLLRPLKEYLKATYGASLSTRCEADDLVSLMMTDPALEDFKRIAIGRDKDFKSIPGWHYQMPKKMSEVGSSPKPFFITPEEAAHWHLLQTLAGDMTDNIPGCTNVGMVRAERILGENLLLVPSDGVITRGKNKGEKCVRWITKPAASLWDCIVSNYEKVGLSENEALQTARLTHLLRHGEYNAETGEVVLWNPSEQT